MDFSHPKFGSDVKTGDATRTHQEDMIRFITHIVRLSGGRRGVQCRLLKRFKNGSREQGKANGIGFSCGLKERLG